MSPVGSQNIGYEPAESSLRIADIRSNHIANLALRTHGQPSRAINGQSNDAFLMHVFSEECTSKMYFNTDFIDAGSEKKAYFWKTMRVPSAMYGKSRRPRAITERFLFWMTFGNTVNAEGRLVSPFGKTSILAHSVHSTSRERERPP